MLLIINNNNKSKANSNESRNREAKCYGHIEIKTEINIMAKLMKFKSE